MDCLVIGYHESSFDVLGQMTAAKGPASAESQIFRRDQLLVDGVRRPYMEILNYVVNSATSDVGDEDWYHITEVPNLAAVYLTSYLREQGFECEFVSSLPCELPRLRKICAEDPPKVVAVTTTFYVTPFPVLEVSALLRAHCPDARIVIGGPLINNLVGDLDGERLQRVFREMQADVYVVEGQGEATLARLVGALTRDGDVAAIPNCYRRQGDAFVFSSREPESNSLDECGIRWRRFRRRDLGPTVQLRTALSCAFRCSFCDYPIRAGKLSLASLDTVERELSQLAEHGVQNVVFIDDTFNVPEKRFQDLCRMMIRNRFPFSWFSYFRCSSVSDPATFDLAAESGCTGVFLGLESADDRVLRNMHKRATVEQYRRGVTELHQRGITTFVSLIVGFPGETAESVANTIAFLDETAPTFYRAEPFWYNHRSPIAREAASHGLRGAGYRWSHDTMHVEEACHRIDEVFTRTTRSTWMPMYLFDFWALPYLMGKGMTVPQIESFLRSCQELLDGPDVVQQRGGSLPEGLAQLVDEVALAPARFRRSQTQGVRPAAERAAGPGRS